MPIDLSVDGDDISVSKTFSVDDFKKVPKPLHVDRTNLRVGASKRSLSLDGRVDLSIDRLGTGFLEGKGSIRNGFALAGGFTANTDVFDSDVDLAYANDQASGHGTLDIDKPGKVPGVSKAHFDVVYENEHLSATGSADFDIPGKPHGDVHLDYDPVQGLSFGGTVKIGKLSGLKGAEATVAVTERNDGGGYVVRARGTATPDIKGVTGEATLDYDDGAFLAVVKVHVTKGKLDGILEAGATNRPLDELGRPMLGPVTPLPKVEKFGAGTARLELNQWLKGDAGFRLLPSGDVSVSGTLLVTGVKLWEGSQGDPHLDREVSRTHDQYIRPAGPRAQRGSGVAQGLRPWCPRRPDPRRVQPDRREPDEGRRRAEPPGQRIGRDRRLHRRGPRAGRVVCGRQGRGQARRRPYG